MLCASPNIIRTVILRVRWVGHVARIGEKRNVYKVFSCKTRKKEANLEDLDIDGKIILK